MMTQQNEGDPRAEVVAAINALADKIGAQLADTGNSQITLTRTEAVDVLGNLRFAAQMCGDA